MSDRPCHLSGSGRSDFTSRRTRSAFTLSSPVLVLNSVRFGADDVADVPALEGVVHDLAQRFLLQEDLDLAGAIGQLGEARLAHDALEQHAAAHLHADGVRLEPGSRR